MSSLQARGAPPVGCPQLHIHCHPHLPHDESSNILLSFAPIPFPGKPKYRQTGVCKCGYTKQHNSGNAMDKLIHELIISDTHTVFKSVTMIPTISKLVFMHKKATSAPSNFNPSITASLHCAIFNPAHAAGLCALHQVNAFLGYFKFKTPLSWVQQVFQPQ